MIDSYGEYWKDNLKCDYCHHLFKIKAKKGITYLGIDEHHNPPEFLSEFLGEIWNGEFYNLCRKHHRELHNEILKILHKNSNSLKFINSEYWILQRMTINQIKKARDEIYIFTKEWIKKRKEDDTTTT